MKFSSSLQRYVSILFKLFIFLIGVYGMCAQFVHSKDKVASFCYYTTISNEVCIIFALIWSLILISGKQLNFKYYFPLKGGSIIAIIVTHLIFHFLLRPLMKEKNPEFLSSSFNLILHYIVPLSTLFDYILFDEKGKFKYTYAIPWVAVPCLYIPFAYAKTYLTGMFDFGMNLKYPYTFFFGL